MTAPLTDYPHSIRRNWEAAMKYNDLAWMRRILKIDSLPEEMREEYERVLLIAEAALTDAEATLDAYLESIKPAPALMFEFRTHNGDKVPVNMFQDYAGAVPATTAGHPVKMIEDPVSGLQARDFGTTPTLQFDTDGYPVVRLVAGAYSFWDPVANDFKLMTGVKSVWAISKKNAVSAKYALVTKSDAFSGLWETASAGDGQGFAILGQGSTDESRPETIANNESMARARKLHNGFIYAGNANYACNGRLWHKFVAIDPTASVNNIGFNNLAGGLYEGDIYSIALSADGNPAAIDKVSSRLGALYNLAITSLFRPLIVCTGNSITVGAQTTGNNNTYPDQLQRWLDVRNDRRWRTENVAVGGWQTPQLTAADYEGRYWSPVQKYCVFWEYSNQIAGTTGDRTVEAALMSGREFYLAKKAEGYIVIALTVIRRNEMGSPPPAGTVTIAEHARKADEVNAALRAPGAIGYYQDYLVDVAADPRFQNPDNATYYADHVHLTDEGCRVVAEEFVGPAILAITNR